MVTLYGISNCDTVRKARKWLDAHDLEYRFHDFRKDGLEARQVRGWLRDCGWETLLNRRGTTWRKLSPSVRDNVDESGIVALLVEHPTLIKRPVLDTGKIVRVGFAEAEYAKLFRI